MLRARNTKLRETSSLHIHLFLEEVEMKTVTTAMLAVTLLIGVGWGNQANSSGEKGKPSKPPGVSLHMAALKGNIEAVRQHIKAGSDLNEKDAYGSTPLIVATVFGKTEVARALIEAGADMKIRDNYGSTPLHIAALLGRTEIVKALLDKGANKYLRNNAGSSAFDIVAAPFEEDKGIYDSLAQGLGPLGLKLDCERIETTRPKIAEMLRPRPEDLQAVKYTPLPGDEWKVSTPAEQGLDSMLVAELYLDAAEMERLYGLLVIKNGHLIAEGYFNEGAIEQKARLQSVTKSYTSALVGIALNQGCLSSVDQKMTHFFPEVAGQITDPRKAQITIRDMLQMRAGYPWEEMDPGLFEILYTGFRPSLLVDFPLTSDPGTAFQYSNLTSHLLGVIVARACDTDLKSFAQENLFSPIDAEVGKWIQDWEGYYNGHADLHFTARDMGKFGLLYLGEGEYQGKQIISAGWVHNSLKSYSEDTWVTLDRLNKVGRYFRDLGYGYQWWSARVDDHHLDFAWGHGGQLIVLLDELDMIVVVTSDPFFGQHDDQSWKHEQANINLVGKFIKSLPRK
jgi:CubicO group peptidase (beta-lactamase class C family)